MPQNTKQGIGESVHPHCWVAEVSVQPLANGAGVAYEYDTGSRFLSCDDSTDSWECILRNRWLIIGG